jgi:hypothetical protein
LVQVVRGFWKVGYGEGVVDEGIVDEGVLVEVGGEWGVGSGGARLRSREGDGCDDEVRLRG